MGELLPGVAATLLADAPSTPYRDGISLLHGWFPAVVQLIAVVVLVCAIGWRSRRWRTVWLPLAVLAGVASVVVTHWYVAFAGMADNAPAPVFWAWVGVAGLGVGVAALGWRSARWWRRGVSVLAVVLALLSCGVALNQSVVYFTTVQMAWDQLTARSLPDQVEQDKVSAMRRDRMVPVHGTVVAVTIPSDASHFKHRTEFVYLPPAWYATDPPPRLPAVMMIGGQFNTPADWIRQGDAITTIDRFAAAHRGNAPLLVFVDAGGSFNNDTECVNGPRGAAADHLTRDVVPFVQNRFGASLDSAGWGVVGFSMGGTCAVDLTVMHPDLFSAFVDIAGDLGPAAGTKEQTITRLFGGDAAAWAAFNPTTVIAKHGAYRGVSGWFAVSTGPQAQQTMSKELGGSGRHTGQRGETEAANRLCALGRANGIDCTVNASTGKHNWPFAADVFASKLPWLADHLGTPA